MCRATAEDSRREERREKKAAPEHQLSSSTSMPSGPCPQQTTEDEGSSWTIDSALDTVQQASIVVDAVQQPLDTVRNYTRNTSHEINAAPNHQASSSTSVRYEHTSHVVLLENNFATQHNCILGVMPGQITHHYQPCDTLGHASFAAAYRAQAVVDRHQAIPHVQAGAASASLPVHVSHQPLDVVLLQCPGCGDHYSSCGSVQCSCDAAAAGRGRNRCRRCAGLSSTSLSDDKCNRCKR